MPVSAPRSATRWRSRRPPPSRRCSRISPRCPRPPQGGDDLAAAALDTGDPKLLDTILRRLPGGLTWTPAARIAFAKALAARDTLLGPLFLAKYAGPPAPDDQSQPLLAYAVARGDLEQVRDAARFRRRSRTPRSTSPATRLSAN